MELLLLGYRCHKNSGKIVVTYSFPTYACRYVVVRRCSISSDHAACSFSISFVEFNVSNILLSFFDEVLCDMFSQLSTNVFVLFSNSKQTEEITDKIFHINTRKGIWKSNIQIYINVENWFCVELIQIEMKNLLSLLKWDISRILMKYRTDRNFDRRDLTVWSIYRVFGNRWEEI